MEENDLDFEGQCSFCRGSSRWYQSNGTCPDNTASSSPSKTERCRLALNEWSTAALVAHPNPCKLHCPQRHLRLNSPKWQLPSLACNKSVSISQQGSYGSLGKPLKVTKNLKTNPKSTKKKLEEREISNRFFHLYSFPFDLEAQF